MGAITRNGIWDRGLGVLNTVRDAVTNTILAMIGDEITEAPTIDDKAEWWQHIGFASRPAKPEKGKAGPQVVILRGSERDACIASRDTRAHPLYGSLDYGETSIYAAGPDGTGQARVMLKGNGGVHIYTREGNTPEGVGMVIQLDAENNSIRMLQADGHGIIIDGDGIKLTAKESSLTLNADGTLKLVCTGQAQIDGASILLGSIAVAVTNAALKGPAGVSGTPSLKTLIE